MMYAIIDLETTGGVATKDGITEIAIYRYDGEKIVDEFVSLVNPGMPIPRFVSRLTGITDEMVSTAPPFYQVAKRVVEITEGCTIVAHNSSFDYYFLKNAFKNLGYKFCRNSLCTVILSRKLIPNEASYSLGKLCRSLGIGLENRHRASGDALATVKLFELLLSVDKGNIIPKNISIDTYNLHLHPNIPQESIDALDDVTGVYYMHDRDGNILYVGKSKNIRNQVLAHFSEQQSPKSGKMRQMVADISFEPTGSELVAMLVESIAIKKHQPMLNVAQKNNKPKFGIYQTTNAAGYIQFKLSEEKENGLTPITKFSSKKFGIRLLEGAVERFKLCPKLVGLEQGAGACFSHRLKKCKGACAEQEPTETYNKRAKRATAYLQFGQERFFLIDKGRHSEERSIVHVEDGVLSGVGYLDISEGANSINQLRDAVKPFTGDNESEKIISQYIRKRKMEKIVRY